MLLVGVLSPACSMAVRRLTQRVGVFRSVNTPGECYMYILVDRSKRGVYQRQRSHTSRVNGAPHVSLVRRTPRVTGNGLSEYVGHSRDSFNESFNAMWRPYDPQR